MTAVAVCVIGCKAHDDSAPLADDSDAVPQPVAIQVVSGLQEPVALVFLSQTRWLAAERRTGRIRCIEQGRLLPAPFATLPVPDRADAPGIGLLDLAVDPHYPDHPYIYASYTPAGHAGAPDVLRVTRLTVQAGQGVDPYTLIDDLPVSAKGVHTSGKLLFAADGKLYVTVGDADRPALAQDYDALAGKVLRYNADGTVPTDNPLEKAQTAYAENPSDDSKQLEGDKTPVYTLGQCNPLGITMSADTGDLYVLDEGTAHDMIQHLLAADNYGWPEDNGSGADPRYHAPLWTSGTPLAPAGATFYTGAALPQYRGNLLFSSSIDGKLRRAIFASSDAISGVEIIPTAGDHARLAVAMGPDGDLYFTDSDSIFRLTAARGMTSEP